MKHFLAIVYMVSFVFVLKAQQQALIYGCGLVKRDNFGISSYNIVTNTYKTIVDELPISFGIYSNGSTVDNFNNRYFYISSCNNCNFIPAEEKADSFTYIIAVNLKTKDLEYYKTGFKYASELHYNPISNTIIFLAGNKGALVELNLSTRITKIVTYLPSMVGIYAKTAYDWKHNRYFFTELDSLNNRCFTVLDLNTGIKNKLLSSNWKLLTYPVWHDNSSKIYAVDKDSIVSISFQGEKTYFGYIYDTKAIHRIGIDNFLVIQHQNLYYNFGWHSNGESIKKLNITTGVTESAVPFYKGSMYWVETVQQEKPYLQANKNTYTSTYGKSYRWLWNNQLIENSNTQTYTPTQCGYYKVEVTHLDGRVDTSEAEYYEVNDANGNTIESTFATAFPNPFHTNLKIQYKTCHENEVVFKVLDLQGKLIYTHKTAKIPAGEHAMEWSAQLKNLRSGLYIVQIFSGNDLVSTQKVVKL